MITDDSYAVDMMIRTRGQNERVIHTASVSIGMHFTMKMSMLDRKDIPIGVHVGVSLISNVTELDISK
jgi:hypothetical protein